jgi:hypothetical protein
MTRTFIGCIALLATVANGAPAARQATPPRGTGSAQAPAAVARATVTLTGCLYREEQIPGRTPNIAERAGIMEDYILANATEPAGTPATGSMYKIEKIPADKLKALVGKRIEVVGTIDPEGKDLRRRPTGTAGGVTPDRGLGPDKISLPDFEALSIREVSGQCAASPGPQPVR